MGITFKELHKKYKDTVEVYDNDSELVKILAANINVSEGWDYIPEGYHSAGVMSYRGNDIWYFRHSYIEREEIDDDDLIFESDDYEYIGLKFPGAAVNAEMETYAKAYVMSEDMGLRFVGYLDNELIIPELNFN